MDEEIVHMRNLSMQIKFFVCSELAKKTFIDEGLPQHKIYVNKLGVSLEQFISSKTRAYDIESNNVNILSVGAVIPRKGHPSSH